MDKQIRESNIAPSELFKGLASGLLAALRKYAADPEVAGFKSIACYRTGLDVSVVSFDEPAVLENGMERPLMTQVLVYATNRTLRLADKQLNDFVVNVTMRVAGECGKPGMRPTRALCPSGS